MTLCDFVSGCLHPRFTAHPISPSMLRSDFDSSSEYVSAVRVNHERLGGRYLESGGSQDACDRWVKIVDREPVSAAGGEVRVRIETSSEVNC